MTIYQPHIFVAFSVSDVREALQDCTDNQYPTLSAMTDDELDGHLDRCAHKGYNIWNFEGGLDLDELENLA